MAKESPRLSKLVSELAQCSRREADEWIENGWVSVDGVAINRLGARVNPKAKITIKEVARARSSESVSIVFNKPRDFPGPAAEEGRDAIAALIRADNHWAEDNSPLSFQPTHLRGLAQAGRLETEEGGMLAFTQEGSVARRLSGGDSRLEKEYHVRVEGELAADGLDLLRRGLALDNVKLPRAQVSWLSDQQMRFVLPDGKKGQIQRMCELVGLQVTDIKRVRIGSVSLGKLPPGQWRYLRADERF
ncbi:pseudouridine synthase [Candidatus Accumulibacter phosphatis]|uniref:pseudouridine synthase n=1 Tax=Candidatus Accumulibacter phosphatis TaxID=327160 RepID=UPI00145CFDD2|nr:RNA pseudouridine synthase [Candidatus Accumulibacter phosphatis]